MGVHVAPILNPPPNLPPHAIPQGCPSAPALSALFHASNLDWRSISYMVIYTKLKLQYFGHLMRKVDSLEKTLMLGGIGGRRRRR